MPVEGFPDPSRHRICRRCRKWFAPEEGSLALPEATGPLGSIRALRATVMGRESDLQFQCHRCTVVRRFTQIAIWSLLVAVIATVLILERLGILGR